MVAQYGTKNVAERTIKTQAILSKNRNASLSRVRLLWDTFLKL